VVRVAEEVWSHWQALVDEPTVPSVLMLFTPVSDPAGAVGAVRESVSEILAPREAALETSDDPDPPWPGEWDWLGVPNGVLLAVSDCDLFEELMRELAAALERRGLDGVFDRHRLVSSLPQSRPFGHVLSCHMRVRGERVRSGGATPVYRSSPDPDALAAVIAAVDRWCKRLGDEAATYEITKALGPVTFGFHDDTAGALREAFEDGLSGVLAGGVDSRWREVRIGAYVAGIGLDAGGADLDAGNWRPELEELMDLLRGNGALLAYAYIRRRSLPGGFDPSFERDWPTRPNNRPRGGGFTEEAFEDVFAPDAFAVQLLGSGYAGRVPDAPSYHRERVGDNVTLLEHRDLPGWFDAPFVPYGQRPDPGDPPPPVLAEARRELEPILYTPGALSRAGHTDVPAL
jgi:hypothetical protein